jgi:hypothetical protein
MFDCLWQDRFVAGGMSRGRGPTLEERVGSLSHAQHPPGRRHCWVVDAPGHPGSYPGLLAEWRRRDDSWEGRVVYAIEESDREYRLVERWVPSGCLRVDGTGRP